MGATKQLPQETLDALGGKFASANDNRWVVGVAARDGWLAANRAYLAAMRQRGAEEMAAIIDAAGVARPVALPEAVQLLKMALPLWACGTRVKPMACQKGSAALEIRVVNCPIYAQLQKTHWRGVTACGNWHRRQGWYDALGLIAEDTLLKEKKWGYGACVIRVKLRQAPCPN